MQPIVLDRYFRPWAYGIGHSRLVLRSMPPTSGVEQLAVYFYDVRAAELRPSYKPLTLSEADQDRRDHVIAFAEKPPRHQHRMLCLAVSSGAHPGYVLCHMPVVVAEPEGPQPGWRSRLEPLPGARRRSRGAGSSVSDICRSSWCGLQPRHFRDPAFIECDVGYCHLRPDRTAYPNG
jgi:hypothetical protein